MRQIVHFVRQMVNNWSAENIKSAERGKGTPEKANLFFNVS